MRIGAVRGFAVVIATAAMTIASVVPAHASEDATDGADGTAEVVASVAPDIGAIEQPELVGDEFVADGGELMMSAPVVIDDGITIGGGDAGGQLTIEVGFGAGFTPAELASDGSVVYAADDGSSVVVQATSDSVRVQTVIDAPDASHEIPYTFAEGFVPGSDGERFFVREGSGIDPSVYSVEAPWAFDAMGAPVDTHFEIRDDTLVQVVAPSASAVYPIVADPTWKWVSAGYGLQLTRAETRDVANAASIALACGAVGKLAANHPAIVAACYIIGGYLWSQAQIARGRNTCIFLQVIPAPAIWRGC